MSGNDLLEQMPPSLKQQRHVALREFKCARDPLYRKQLEAMQKTEKQRREESGRSSLMVKLDKPFPELKPKNELGPLREKFNTAWAKERREARIHMYATREKEPEFPGNGCKSAYTYER